MRGGRRKGPAGQQDREKTRDGENSIVIGEKKHRQEIREKQGAG